MASDVISTFPKPSIVTNVRSPISQCRPCDTGRASPLYYRASTLPSCSLNLLAAVWSESNSCKKEIKVNDEKKSTRSCDLMTDLDDVDLLLTSQYTVSTMNQQVLCSITTICTTRTQSSEFLIQLHSLLGVYLHPAHSLVFILVQFFEPSRITEAGIRIIGLTGPLLDYFGSWRNAEGSV
jgi:hypothetical protein